MKVNTDKIINAGLLAYGMSGRVFHAPFLNAHEGFNFKAIVERNRKIAQNDYPNLISYNCVDDLLNDDEIDLVAINTPNNLHYEHSKLALQNGKSILVEKPFTATSKQAKEIFALAKEVGKKVFVYQNRRYDSGFKAVKKIIESGELGNLVEVHFRYDRYRNEIGPKTFKEDLVEATGLQYDLGPHLIDQAIALFGKPEKYHKVLSKNRAGTKVDDYFAIQLSYPNQLNVFLTSSMLVAAIKEAFVINGTNGSFSKNHADVQEAQLLKGIKPTDAGYGIEKPEDAGILTLVTENGGRNTEILPSEKGDYMAIFEAVYQNLINNKPYPITEEAIITQLEIIES
ncbi:oxidoreductase [Pedobacter changchengzhani]|uniref:Oxidoreductase n=1 Tax=Pedobacter changchengzhani TaxID=2529274 RepID=A0A4R5MRB9_9SPHI|nr:Gfo/Idh/MocA family oxidoreductase [Pedobacter changchengzhani]TDG38039.1 oxidoreductase [Pedobacter changchengzhani]